MIEKLSGKFPNWMTGRCEDSFSRLFYEDGSINFRYGDKKVEDLDEILRLRPVSELLKGHRGLT